MLRREFILGLGAGAAWPLAAHAQLPEGTPRIGVLVGLTADDPEAQARLLAFRQGLAEQGWGVGRNLQMDYRAAGREGDRYRQYAEELVALRPDVLVAGGTPALDALRQSARNLPIVFANATEPAGSTYLARLARPARNTTGVVNFESRFGWKLLELLKQVAPSVSRVAIFRGPRSAGIGQIGSPESVAPKYGVELTTLEDHDAGEIERGIATFVRGPDHGLIVTAQLGRAEREQIVALAARYRLPAVYGFRRYVVEGGLISYGSDQTEPFRRAAGYVHRILNGERPIDLPVQGPARYETVLNAKTAKTLGLDVPPPLLMRVDEVID